MPSGEQTSTSETKPSKFMRPLIRTISKDARRAYEGGFGANTGSNVVPMSKQDTKAYDALTGIANDNSGNKGLSGRFQNIIDNGGFNGAQRSALNGMRQTANSTYDENANPGFQGVLDKTLHDTANAVNLNASANGRYGSGIHEGVLAEKTGDISNQMRMADFNNWLGRKDTAQNNVFNAGQAGIGNLSTAYSGLQMPQTTRLGVGAAYDDLAKRTIDDQNRVNDLPWSQIGRLMGVANGSGNFGTTSTTAPGPNPFLQALGMGATGANLLFGSGGMQNGLLGLV